MIHYFRNNLGCLLHSSPAPSRSLNIYPGDDAYACKLQLWQQGTRFREPKRENCASVNSRTSSATSWAAAELECRSTSFMSAGDEAYPRCTYLTKALLPQAKDFTSALLLEHQTFFPRENRTTQPNTAVEFWIVITQKVLMNFPEEESHVYNNALISVATQGLYIYIQ